MAKIDIYKMDGTKSEQVELANEIFAVKPNLDLMKQALLAQMSNARRSIAHTKDRSEVRGGGIKPWKQKGTGRARAGSSRSPIWVGGGVTFGPRNDRNWTKQLPQKMKQKALFMSLSSKLTDKNIIVLDKLTFSKIKTKQAIGLLEKMPIKNGSILLVLPKNDLNIELSFQNLQYVKTSQANTLNVYDILKNDWLVMTVESIKEIEKIFLHKETKKVSKKEVSTSNKSESESRPDSVGNKKEEVKKSK